MISKRLILILVSFILFLIIFYIYLPSYSKYQRLKKEEERLGQEIEKLKKANMELREQEELLKTDVSYLEKVIRENLGLVKPGETVYKLVPEEAAEVEKRVRKD